MHLDQDGQCGLLFAVHPAFVAALPPLSNPSRTNLVEDNNITLLRYEVRRLTMSLTQAHAKWDLSTTSFDTGRSCLDAVLFLFESLVDENVLDATLDQLNDPVCSLRPRWLVPPAIISLPRLEDQLVY